MFILKAENTEKAGYNVKPRLPGKMCTLTSVVRSQHAIGQTMRRKRICILRTSTVYNKASWCVHSAHGVCVLQNTLVCLFVCLSAPSQDFEQNRLVYGLYLLRMSQKLR